MLVANGPEISLQAAAAARPPVPIVMLANNYDPLARGYIKSLAEPGGNITGVFYRQPELAVKQLELLVEAFPDRKRLAALWDVQSADQASAAERSLRDLAARRLRGRSRRARSNPSACGASACSRAARRGRSGRAGQHCGVPAGAAAIGLDRRPQCADRLSLGRWAMPTTFASTRRNWPRSRRTSSCPPALRAWRRCCRRPAPCRSCSSMSPTQSAPASSIAWRGRAATPPALCSSNTV